MADDIKLVIGVEQSALLKAITNTETLQGKVKKLSAAYSKQNATYKQYNKAVGDLAKSTNKNKKELLDYGKALRSDERVTQRATAKVKALALARKQAAKDSRTKAAAERVAVKATEDLARAELKNAASLKTMRMATDGVYRNQQKRLQMKKLLKAAVVAETMTTEQAIVALKRYNAAQMSSTKVMGTAKNKMNGNNMAVQQLGYQFGDFAVQVQGGTSAFVAFSQQGAQLAGILPMIAGPLGLSMKAAVGLSAALGIGIPIFSAAGRLLYEMVSGAKASESALSLLSKELDKSSSSLEEYISLLEKSGDLGSDGFSKVREGIIGTSKAYRDLIILAKLQASTDLSTSLTEMSKAAAESSYDLLGLSRTYKNTIGLVRSLLGGPSIEEGFKAFNDGLFTVGEFEKSLHRLKNEDSLSGQYEAAKALRTQFLNVVGDTEDLNQEQQEFLTALSTGIFQMELLGAATKTVSGAQRDLTELLKLGRDAARDKNRTNRQTIIDMKSELALAKVGLNYGKESVQSVKLRAEQEAISKNLTTSNAKEYVRLALEIHRVNVEAGEVKDNTGKITWEIKESVNQAQKLRDVMSQVASSSLGVSDRASVLRAKITAAKSGQSIAGAGAQTTTALTLSRGGATADEIARISLEAGKGAEEVEKLEGVLSKLLNPAKAKSGSKSGDKINAFEKLTVELARRKELLGMSEAQATVTKGIWKLEDALGKDRAKYSAAELKAIVQKGIALSETELAAEEAIAQQQALADTLESSMSDAFTSMVDGTKSFKDAMKDMARAVIKQLFEILVVQRLVGSFDAKSGQKSGLVGLIMGAVTPQANGGAWQGGSQVQAYANGGVVNSPTNFGMSGNKVGLMGEAGPEAIMPLKRGANGKLGVQAEGGGGDTIVVHQNFNFQSNGDDSIKKLIAQAAPQISAMTKSSLLNDRRRGGATKAAFG
jgi:hypothetical protein